MKILPNKILTYLTVLFLCNTALAGSTPPPPPAPPVGLPIDSNLLLLFLASVIFGIYKIRQFRAKKSL